MLPACMNFYLCFSSRRRHTRYWRDWSSDVCSSDLDVADGAALKDLDTVVVTNRNNQSDAFWKSLRTFVEDGGNLVLTDARSEERRVGKECRFRWSPYH